MNNIKKSIIFYFISILVIVFVMPLVYKNFLVAKENLNAEQKRLEQQSAYFEEMRRLEKELEEYSVQLTKIETAIPENPSIPSIIKYVESIANNSGVILYDIGSFSTEKFGDHPTLQETTFEIEVEGLNYAEVKRFFDGIESSAKVFLIEEVDIAREEEEESGAIRFKALATIKTYSY